MTADHGQTTPPGLDRRDMLRLVGLLAGLLVIVAIVLLASGGSEKRTTGQLTGVLTTVTPQRLVLQEPNGRSVAFAIRPEDRTKLDLIHLQQHAADALPSIVHYEQEGDERFAVRVDDA